MNATAARWQRVGLALAAGLGMFAGIASAVEIAPDGMMIVDGRRMFVVGLYHFPAGLKSLDDAAASGFNAVRPRVRDDVTLDRLWQHGLRGWLRLPQVDDVTRGGRGGDDAFEHAIAPFREHPALLVWDQLDEALWSCWWGVLEWRRTEEPARQRERLTSLAGDDEKRGRLLAARERADKLLRRGELAAAGEEADQIWVELDGEKPSPARAFADAEACATTRARRLRATYDATKLVDPCHPIWINHAPRNRRADLAAFNEAADVVGCDIYPVPERSAGHSDLPDQSLAAVGAYTELMKAAAGGRPVFMVIQAFGWSDLEARNGGRRANEKPAPSYAEMRFMTFDAIVHGARGVLFYGAFLYDRGSRLWGDLCLLGTDLLELRDVLAAPDADRPLAVSLSPTWTSEGPGVVALAKALGADTWVLAVNENRDPLSYTVCGLPVADGGILEDPGEGLRAGVTGGCATLPIAGFGVHALRPVPARSATTRAGESR